MFFIMHSTAKTEWRGRGTKKDLKKKISYNTINMQAPIQH